MSKHGNSSLISTTSKGRPSKKVRLRRKRKKTEDTQIESADGEQPNQVQRDLNWEDSCGITTAKRRRYPRPMRLLYISQKDLRDKDSDLIVNEVLMRMTPRQLETRCTHNKVHMVLSEQHRRLPFWSNPATISLLGKGPKFIPKAHSLSSKEIFEACAKLKFRLVRAFERYIRRDEHKYMEDIRRETGIQQWTRNQLSRPIEFYHTYVKHFFKCNDDRGAWAGNQMLSPMFDRCLRKLEKDIVNTAYNAKKSLRMKHRWPNISKEEQDVIRRMKEIDVGYNIADKNFGAVTYSKELFTNQCVLHLEDGKGTYVKITDKSKEDLIDDILMDLKARLIPYKKQGKGWAMIIDSLIRDSSLIAEKGKLCKFYIIWKLHKKASADGLRSRPIASAIEYVTGPASRFLHSQLKEAVWKHPHVLNDSLELIRILEGLEFNAADQITLTAADVNALYPPIQIDRGMEALKWFMDYHTSFNPTFKDMILKLAFFVLTNNYVTCQEMGGEIYRQMIGTAMGTTFSVVYAIIFMIRLETPIINDSRFNRHIRLYKRFIDDLFLIWTGPMDMLCEFRRALASADDRISLDWNGCENQEVALDPAKMVTQHHDRVIFLDLDISLQKKTRRKDTVMELLIRPYRKPGNAYAYIPFTSFHARHTFRGWVLAELMRLLTHSSTPEIWKEEGRVFYHHLTSRGYPRWFLIKVFSEVSWSRRAEILTRMRKDTSNEFFKTYKACVLTLRNAPEWPALKEMIDLNLRELVESTFGDIFPERAFLAQLNAPRLGAILKR